MPQLHIRISDDNIVFDPETKSPVGGGYWRSEATLNITQAEVLNWYAGSTVSTDLEAKLQRVLDGLLKSFRQQMRQNSLTNTP